MTAVTTLTIETPIGLLGLHAGPERLTRVEFGAAPASAPGLTPSPVLERAAAQLTEYFAGERTGFDLPVADPAARFDRTVFEAIKAIPYGERIAYKQLTAEAGFDRADVRAVGAAVGRNPIPVIVPCHRVVGADGSLTGYYGGLELKAFLLELEAPQQALT